MSPHLSYEIARARQQEIATATLQAHHRRSIRGAANPGRPARWRRVQATAALGACVAAIIPVTVSGAHASPRTVKPSGHMSGQQFGREIRGLEAKGYVPTSCTIGGTLMRNYRTGQSVTVSEAVTPSSSSLG